MKVVLEYDPGLERLTTPDGELVAHMEGLWKYAIPEKRTTKQNSALHSSLREYAGQLNDAGFSYTGMMKSLKENGVEVPWTYENLKPLFNMIAMAMYNKTSSKVSTKELTTAWDVFIQRMVERGAPPQDFHSEESQARKQLYGC